MRSPIFLATFCAAVPLAAAPATAVVIGPSFQALNIQQPANDPGWFNVGRVDGGSAVYLGNRWVITANHVGEGDLRLSDGRVLAEAPGSSIRLTNTGTTVAPDLRMFRILDDPGLPAMNLAAVAPGVGSQVMMIGAGVNRAPELLGWHASGGQWPEVPLPDANVAGYRVGSGNTMRWGLNTVSAASTFLTDSGTRAFQTTFDRFAVTFVGSAETTMEAQATTGDSGGGVFYESANGWQLAGLMISTTSLTSQPSDAIIYGNRTNIADLSSYRQQIIDLMNRAAPAWQNQLNAYDVNGSGGVGAADVILLVNEILSDGSRALTGSPEDSKHWLDVNGDNRLGTVDLQRVVNEILRANAAAADASPLTALADDGFYNVPEPSSGVLALAAALIGLLTNHFGRRR
jgi:hypothetical protein